MMQQPEQAAAHGPLEGLRSGLPEEIRSRLFLKGDEGYEEARVGRVFNGRRPERYPAAVLLAASIDDVIAGVKLAREAGITVSVRSGGHSWAAWSVRNNALLIDAGQMREMSVDLVTNVITASPAITGGELNPYLKQFGLFFAGGHCPSVGIGGFLLQGGQGWNARGWGWSCEQIIALDIVTAKGELLHVDADQHPELLWSARGAGPGFFGIVVRFYLKARKLVKALTRSTFVFSLDLYDHVMHWLYGIHAQVDTNVEIVALSTNVPVQTVVRERDHSIVVHALCFADSEEEARRSLAPFETCPCLDRALVRDSFVPTSFEQMYEDQIRANPPQARYVSDNMWIGAPAKDAVPQLKNAFTAPPTDKTFCLWYSMAPLRPLPDMAFSRQSDVYFAIYCVWDDAAQDNVCKQWVAQTMRDLEPLSEGLYLGDSDFEVRPARFLSPENWASLCAYREQFDPTHLFESYLATTGCVLNRNALDPQVAAGGESDTTS